MKKSIRNLTIVGFCVAAATGCTEIVTTHGHILKPEQINTIRVGKDSKNEVLRLLGTPSAISTFQDNRWYYMTETAVDQPLKPNQVRDRNILIINFDKEGLVTSLDKKDETSGRAVELNERKTQTQGQKLGFIDHILNNVGIK